MPERERAPRGEADHVAVASGWASHGAARHYARGRYASDRAAGRDPAAVERLLRRHLGALDAPRVLDVPHGAGRLAATLQRRGAHWIGLDHSEAMLDEARSVHDAALVVGAVEHLPFTDGSFDAVVCCRLLHHLDEERELPVAVSELVRVSRDLVLASFWDAGSLHAWRRRSGLRRDSGRRRAISKRRLEQVFGDCGARAIGYAHGLRFVSMQTFVVARKES